MESSLRGRLLVATPPLTDPNFDRTVVLLLEHGEEGALGLVLNRPSEAGLDEALPDWVRVATDPAVVFVGGPVAGESVIGLARGAGTDPDDEAAGWTSAFGTLGTVDLARDPDEVGATIQRLRVFVGYAGWAPGQLEGELEVGAWFVVDAEPDDPFSPEPDDLWRAVLRRQAGRIAMFAHCPPDPSVN